MLVKECACYLEGGAWRGGGVWGWGVCVCEWRGGAASCRPPLPLPLTVVDDVLHEKDVATGDLQGTAARRQRSALRAAAAEALMLIPT